MFHSTSADPPPWNPGPLFVPKVDDVGLTNDNAAALFAVAGRLRLT
ncbi:MAG: hypothetical protein ABI268_11280 [Rhodanobacter sp.]